MEGLFDRSGQAFGGTGDASRRSGTDPLAGCSSKVFYPLATHVAYNRLILVSCSKREISDLATVLRTPDGKTRPSKSSVDFCVRGKGYPALTKHMLTP